MKEKFRGFLIISSDINDNVFKEIDKKYIGETYAISEKQAINNFRYRIGSPSYKKCTTIQFMQTIR